MSSDYRMPSTMAWTQRIASNRPSPARRVMTRDAIAVYRYAVTNPGWTMPQAAAATGLDERHLLAAIDVLRSCRLLQPATDGSQRWAPVSPECAIADLLTDREVSLRREQARLIAAREELLSLQHVYTDAVRYHPATEVVDVVEDVDGRLGRMLADHARHTAGEVCVAHPTDGRARHLDPLHTLLSAHQAGTRMRLIVDTVGQLPGPVVGSGPPGCVREVRTLRPMPLRLMLFDRQTAVLPIGDTEPPTRVAVVRQPDVLRTLWGLFEVAWSSAQPLADDEPTSQLGLDQLRTDILRHLAAGHKDEVVARRVGLSVRTCRRHIAEIMEQLGAGSRFQAGVLAGRHLRGGEPGSIACPG